MKKTSKSPNLWRALIKFFLFLFLFFFGIEAIKSSILNFQVNYDLENLFRLQSLSDIHYLMIGWLGTMIFTSGSSMANLIVGLFPSGLIDTYHSVVTVLGSRIGPDTVLIMVGIANALRSRSVSKGLYVPILEFFITLIVCCIAFIILPATLSLGISASSFTFPFGEGIPVLDIISQLVGLFSNYVNTFVLFSIGGFTFFYALKLFDSIFENDLPDIKPRKNYKSGILGNFHDFMKTKDFSYLLYNPLLSFFLGLIATFITMSAAVSVSLLIPLYVKEKIPLQVIVAFVLGSNIGTFGDTLFIAFLTNQPELIRAMSLMVMSIILITFTLVLFISLLNGFARFLEKMSQSIFGLLVVLLIMVLPPILVFLL